MCGAWHFLAEVFVMGKSSLVGNGDAATDKGPRDGSLDWTEPLGNPIDDEQFRHVRLPFIPPAQVASKFDPPAYRRRVFLIRLRLWCDRGRYRAPGISGCRKVRDIFPSTSKCDPLFDHASAGARTIRCR